MKKLVFITNRSAGNGRGLEVIRQARRHLWGRPLEIRYSESPEQTRHYCREANPEECEALFVVGGDGTVHQALTALMNRHIPVGILPAGTANDLAEELGMYLDWDVIQKMIDEREYGLMDLVAVNGRPFATVGGIGIGAAITHEYNVRRKKSALVKLMGGRMKAQLYSYLAAKAILFRRDQVHCIRVRAEGFESTVSTAALFVCNQASLGGDLTVAPKASNSDRKFNVLITTETGRLEMIDGLGTLKHGKLPRGAITLETGWLTLEDVHGRPIDVFGDGEYMLSEPRVEFRILPEALCVYRRPAGFSPPAAKMPSPLPREVRTSSAAPGLKTAAPASAETAAEGAWS